MSASEDLEVADDLDSSSSFTSHQPAQVQNLALISPQASSVRESDGESELLPEIDVDNDSDHSFLPPSKVGRDTTVHYARHPGNLNELGDTFAAEESYYTRPNRYYGPASTWRSWTKDDRDVAESLKLDRAQDLSIHLYNAHALRSQTKR